MNIRAIVFLLGTFFYLWIAPAFSADTSGQTRAEMVGRSLIGTPAPALVLKSIDGTTIDLGHLYGKQAVYLKFWATWCVPCREQMPHFEHIYETAGPDLAVIGIDTGFNDSIEEVVKYRQNIGITMPLVVDDGEAGAAFHLRVTPQHIVIGRDGRIQYVGHLADARLDAALVAARSASPSRVASAAVQRTMLRVTDQFKAGDVLSSQQSLTIDGKRVSLRDPTKRRPTLLIFLSPWCESYLATTRPALSASCRHMREEVNALTGEKGVRWLGIASGLWATTDDLRDYRKRYGVRIPLSLDDSGKLFRAFGVMQVPTALLINSGGRIARRIDLKDLASPATLRATMESL